MGSKRLLCKLILVTNFLALASCGPTSTNITSSGRNIRVLTSNNRLDNCTYIGPLSSRIGSNFQNYQHNVKVADAEIRNKAAQMGATHIVVTPPQSKTSSGNPWIPSGTNCRNCVEMSGVAYRCRSRTEAQRRQSRTTATKSISREEGVGTLIAVEPEMHQCFKGSHPPIKVRFQINGDGSTIYLGSNTKLKASSSGCLRQLFGTIRFRATGADPITGTFEIPALEEQSEAEEQTDNETQPEAEEQTETEAQSDSETQTETEEQTDPEEPS